MNGQQKFSFLIILLFSSVTFSQQQLPAPLRTLVSFKAVSLQRHTAESIVSSKSRLVRSLRHSHKAGRNRASLVRKSIVSSNIEPYVPEEVQAAFSSFRESNQGAMKSFKEEVQSTLKDNLGYLSEQSQDITNDFKENMSSEIGNVVYAAYDEIEDAVTDYADGESTQEDCLARVNEALFELKSGLQYVFYTNIPELRSDVSVIIDDFKANTSSELSKAVEDLKSKIMTNVEQLQARLKDLKEDYDTSLANDDLYTDVS